MAYWFINIGELEELAAQFGYNLIEHSELSREYDQDNFPKKNRMGRACNLLFELKTN